MGDSYCSNMKLKGEKVTCLEFNYEVWGGGEGNTSICRKGSKLKRSKGRYHCFRSPLFTSLWAMMYDISNINFFLILLLRRQLFFNENDL